MNRLPKALALAAGVAACLVAVRVNATSSAPVYRDLELLGQSLAIVRDAYVDPVDVSALVDFALRSMVESLDQHSSYLDSQDLEVVNQESEGTFGGVGLVVASRNGFITVVSPLEGSPAAEAGIRPADTIVEIDKETTQGMSLRRAVTLLRGAADTRVTLLVRRRGVEADFQVEIRRKIITVPSVSQVFTLAGPDGSRIGYVRLATFTSGTVARVRQALDRVRDDRCSALILDLRANPGGLLEEAIGVCDLLLPEGLPICTTVGGKGSRRRAYVSASPRATGEIRMAALVEEGSASGAEIVAAALQDNRMGLVVGRPTYGKGTIQEIRELGDGTAVKLTTARWFTPGGFCIDRELGQIDTTLVASSTPLRVGVVPNMLVEDPTTDGVRIEMAAAFSQAWLDSMARVVGQPPVDPAAYGVDDAILRGAAEWLAHESALARSEPDSAEALAERVMRSPESARLFLGAEFARRWWGPTGAARYAVANDTLVATAIAALVDGAAYEALLDTRAPAVSDTLAPDDLE